MAAVVVGIGISPQSQTDYGSQVAGIMQQKIQTIKQNLTTTQQMMFYDETLDKVTKYYRDLYKRMVKFYEDRGVTPPENAWWQGYKDL